MKWVFCTLRQSPKVFSTEKKSTFGKRSANLARISGLRGRR